MASPVYDLIRSAVLNKRQVIADYNGYRREMCPHVIGLKGGREQALFFQFAGQSSKGLLPGGEWRCIPIAGLRNVEVRDGPWHTDTNHSQRQSCVDAIDVEVTY